MRRRHNILRDVDGKPMEPFDYHDKGIMAMIGHNAAIAEMGEHRHELHGAVGYAAWLGVHAYLMGVSRQRRDAFVSWAWDEFGKSRVLDTSDEATAARGGREGWLSTTTSSSSAPAPAAARSRTRSRRSGKKILLLERGDFLPREMENWDPEPVFVDGRYISKDTWYDADGKPFQPQVHYFVGGATKLYGAALYRLRPQDFGELKHVDGVSPAWPLTYDDFEPYYTKAEWLYQVHGNHGEDPTEGHWSKQYPWPAVSHEPRIQQLVRRPRSRRATTRSTRRAGSCSTRPTATAARASAARGATATRAWSTPSPTPRRSPCDRDRSTTERDAARRTPRSCRLETDAIGSHRHRRGRVARRRARRRTRPTSSSCRRAPRTARKILLASANDQHPNGLANGSDQVGRNYMFHNSKAVVALSKEPNDTRLPEDARRQRLLLRRRRTTTGRSATSRWSASRTPRR